MAMVTLGVRSRGRLADSLSRRGRTLTVTCHLHGPARACGANAADGVVRAGFLDRKAGILDIAGAKAEPLERTERAGDFSARAGGGRFS